MTEKGFNRLTRLSGFIVLAIFSTMLVLQLPSVQQKIASFATKKINEVFSGKVSLSGIHLSPSGMIRVSDLLLLDPEPYTEDRYNTGFQSRDTILYVRSLSASFTLSGLLKGEGIHLGRCIIDGGQANLVSEPDGKWKSNLERMTHPKHIEDHPAGPNLFDIRKVVIRNFHFSLTNFNPGPNKHRAFGINYQDLDVSISEIKGHSMKMAGSVMTAVCDRCELKEKCGYHLENLTGRCRVGQGLALIENIHLVDQWSDTWFDCFTMTYDNAKAFQDYVNKVRMEVLFRPGSILGMKTIGYFSGSIPDFNAILTIHGCHAYGITNDITVDYLHFTDNPSKVSGSISGRLTDAAANKDIGLDFDISDLKGNGQGLCEFAKEFFPTLKIAFAQKARKDSFRINAKSRGTLNKLDAAIKISTLNNGDFEASAEMKNLQKKNEARSIQAKLQTNKLNVEAFTGNKNIGPVSMNAGGIVELGKNLQASIDSLNISLLSFKDYNYSGISVQGRMADRSAVLRLCCNDSNLQFDLDANANNINEDDFNIELESFISKADLSALKLWKNNSKLDFNGSLSATMNRIDRDYMGSIDIAGLEVEDEKDIHELGDISISSYVGQDNGRINLYSDYADLVLDGDKSFKEILTDFKRATIGRELPALFPKGVSPFDETDDDYEYSNFNMDLNFHDTREILDLLMPGVYIADSTNVCCTMNSIGAIDGIITSSRLAYGKTFIKDLDLNFNNTENNLSIIFNSRNVNANGFQINGVSFSTFAHSNSFALNLNYDGMSGDHDSMSEIYLNGDLYRTATDSLIVSAHPLASFVRLGGQNWDISGSDAIISKTNVEVNQLVLQSGNQSISINGLLSKTKAGELDVDINDLSLEILNHLNQNGLTFSGITSGKAVVKSPLGKDLGAKLNISLNGLEICGIEGGDYSIQGEANSEKTFVYVKNNYQGRNALHLQGEYVPETQEVDASLSLDNFQIGLVAPFMQKLFNQLDGGLDGQINLRGTTEAMQISSRGTELKDVCFKLAATGVPYKLNGPLHLDNEALWFDNISITDDAKGKARLNGAIHHEHLRNLRLDAGLEMDHLLAIDKADPGNGSLYGVLAASGNAKISGPFNDLFVDAIVGTTDFGEVHVPLNNSLTRSDSELLSFKKIEENIDPYELMLANMNEIKKSAPNNFGAHVKLTVNPEVTAYMELDKSMGNMISVNGQANIDLNFIPAKDRFSLNGDYNISDGKFHFDTAGLIDKAFTLKPGGSIKFAGDIMDAELDITANYNLKASLSTLLADSTSVATRKPVTCGIHISDRLRNPSINFSVSVPDLDPTTKAKVESALNTEDKVQKQFVALLMLGTFIPNDQYGVVNGTNMLYSNVSEVMMGQVNSILQKLNIPLDLGFNYQQNTGGRDIFDVAISTQLFNNRVVVNGSVGNRQYKTSSSAADVVGDLDIDIKLDKKGEFLLSLFSHSTDSYTTFLDNSQRNGIGISVQKEYNSFIQFFRNIFKSRKQREEDALMELISERKQRIINIE